MNDSPRMIKFVYALLPTPNGPVNVSQWTHDHLFKAASVWDVPLLKPRFGCIVDLSPTLEGYDVAGPLAKRVEAFHHGARYVVSVQRTEEEYFKTRGASSTIERGIP